MKKLFFIVSGMMFLSFTNVNLERSDEDDYPPTHWHCSLSGDLVTGYCNILPPNHPDGDTGLMCFSNTPPNGMPCNNSVGTFDKEEGCEECS